MKIAVINGSPAGKNSITLQTVFYLEKFFPSCTFKILHVGQKIKSIEKDFRESEELLKEADLLLFCYPVYTFLVPAQLHRFIELIKEHRLDLSGKSAAQLTTSKHFYDTTAHRFIQDNCDDLDLNYIGGLSADMEDLLNQQGRKDAISFFRYVLWCMEHHFAEPRFYQAQKMCPQPDSENSQAGFADPALSEYAPFAAGQAVSDTVAGSAEPPVSNILSGSAKSGRSAAPADSDLSGKDPSGKDPSGKNPSGKDPSDKNPSDKNPAGKVVIVTDSSTCTGNCLQEMIACFSHASAREIQLADLAEFPFAGGCLGCFHCAADGSCIYKDGFDDYLRSHIQSADAIVYAFTVKDHSMGFRMKLYDDRQFCNGHRTVTMGKPVGYLVCGCLDREPNLQTLMEARAQVGGNFLAGIAAGTTMEQADPQIHRLAAVLDYAVENSYQPPKNFYGVGGLKIFRDLIYQMQGLMREDHRFYKKHGFYDFPQKRKGRIAAMYLVGAMMSNKTLSRKMGGKMTEGMLMPYQKVLKNTQNTEKSEI